MTSSTRPQSLCSDSMASNSESQSAGLLLQNEIYRKMFAQVDILYPEMYQFRKFKIPLKKPVLKTVLSIESMPTAFLWKMKPEFDEKENELVDAHDTKEYVQKSILAPYTMEVTIPKVTTFNSDPYQWSCDNFVPEIKHEPFFNGAAPSLLSHASQSTFLLRPGVEKEICRVGPPSDTSSKSSGALIIVTPKNEVSSDNESCLTTLFKKTPCRPTKRGRRRFNKFYSENDDVKVITSGSSEEDENDVHDKSPPIFSEKKYRFDDNTYPSIKIDYEKVDADFSSTYSTTDDCPNTVFKSRIKPEAKIYIVTENIERSSSNSISPVSDSSSSSGYSSRSTNCSDRALSPRCAQEEGKGKANSSVSIQIKSENDKEDNDEMLIIGLNETELNEFLL